MLDLFHQYLVDDGVSEDNIIHMNLESLKYRSLVDYLSFYDYVSEHIVKNEKTYLIFDELQMVEHWEKAIESFRLDFDVDIGKVGEAEIDFVAEKPDDKMYIQVTESMQSEETRERELRPLRMIPDNYEKIVLSMDRNYIKSYEGIKSLYLIDWLLQ